MSCSFIKCNGLIVISILILLFSSCGTESLNVSYVKIESNTNNLITNVETLEDEIIFMSGDYWLLGEIGTSTDGITFVTDSFSNKIVLDFQVTESADLITVGIDANIHFKPMDQPWRYERLSEYGILKGIIATPTGYLAVGGKAQRFGWIYKLDKAFNLLSIKEYNNELTSIAKISENIYVAVGYGIILRSENEGDNWVINDQEGDYYTDVYFPTPDRGYIVGDRGAYLISDDQGIIWDEIESGNSTLGANPRYRKIYFEDASNGYIVGDNGTFWMTEDAGDSWVEYNIETEEDLYDCVRFQNALYVVGSRGFIGQINI